MSDLDDSNWKAQNGGLVPRRDQPVNPDQVNKRRGVIVRDGGQLQFYDLADYADLASAFNDAKATHGLTNVEYKVIPGDYGTVTTAFDFTGAGPGETATLDFRGITFTYAHAGSPCFDFTASNNSMTLYLNGSSILGGGTDTPACGILFARGSGGGSAGGHKVEGGSFDQQWSAAPVYNIGGARCEIENVTLFNRNGAGRSVYYIGNENPDAVSSPFATATTGQADQFKVIRCSLSADSGPAAVGEVGPGAASHTVRDVNVNAGSATFWRFDASSADTLKTRLHSVYGEAPNESPTNVVDFVAPGTGTNEARNVEISGMEIGGGAATRFMTVPTGVDVRGWTMGSPSSLNDNEAPTGIQIDSGSSTAFRECFINADEFGDITNPGGGVVNYSKVVASTTNLTRSVLANTFLFDRRSGFVELNESRIYLGGRTSSPHTASGSGDVYIDLSQNPPKWQCDDPTDAAWETM